MTKTVSNIDLAAVRQALLHLHKLLLEFQRRQYEEAYRKITTPGEMYNLVTNHEDFRWLRSLSEVIVSLDEALDNQDISIDQADLVSYIRKLISPDQQGNEFSQKYHQALHNFPDALVAHGQVVRLLSL